MVQYFTANVRLYMLYLYVAHSGIEDISQEPHVVTPSSLAADDIWIIPPRTIATKQKRMIKRHRSSKFVFLLLIESSLSSFTMLMPSALGTDRVAGSPPPSVQHNSETQLAVLALGRSRPVPRPPLYTARMGCICVCTVYASISLLRYSLSGPL